MNVVNEAIDLLISDGDTPPQPLATKQYSGKFQVRIPPELHRNLAINAAEQGVSLNRYVSSRLS